MLNQIINVPKLRFGEFEGEWVEKKLGDIAIFFNSKRIALTESDRKSGDYPYYGASGIIDYVEDYIFDGEYILLGEDGANIVMRNSRLVFLANGKFWLNNHAHIFQAKESNSFLCEALERINYSKYNTGTTQPKLNSVIVKKIKLYLPQKQEQKKISTYLTSIDKKIEQLNQKRTLLESYKKGVMQKIFSQEIRFKRDDGGVFEDRKKYELKNILEISSNKFNPKKYNIKKKCIELEHLSQNRGQLLGYTFTNKQGSIKNIFNKNEVLFGKLRPYLKKYWKSTFEGVCSSEIWVLKGKKIINEYLFYLIQDDKFNQIANISSGSKMPRSDWKYMAEIPFLIPQKQEQQKISNFLTSIDQKITQNNQSIEQMKAFKKGLLQQMFV